jgi:hypothetical protein
MRVDEGVPPDHDITQTLDARVDVESRPARECDPEHVCLGFLRTRIDEDKWWNSKETNPATSENANSTGCRDSDSNTHSCRTGETPKEKEALHTIAVKDVCDLVPDDNAQSIIVEEFQHVFRNVHAPFVRIREDERNGEVGLLVENDIVHERSTRRKRMREGIEHALHTRFVIYPRGVGLDWDADAADQRWECE